MTARLMTVDTKRILGVDMVVNSQWGGAGAKAHRYALGRPRDGYTILSLSQTHLYTIARGQSPLKISDVVGIARAIDDPTLIVVHRDSSYASLEGLIGASQRKPLNWGVSNVGGTEHIGLARFAASADIGFTAVPFGSGARMLQALLSKSVDATLPNVSEVAGLIREGSIRALAVMSDKRLRAHASIPTTYELGYPVKTSTTRGFAVLRGTPQARIDLLSEAITKALHEPAFSMYLENAGLDVEGSLAGQETWNRQIKEEYEQAVTWLGELGLLE